MRRIRLFIAIVFLLLVCASPAIASDITDAKYVADVSIYNASGSLAEEVATVFDLSTQDLIDGKYILDDASNTAIRSSSGADTPYMPAVPSGEKWCIWTAGISAYAYQNYSLYTSGTTDMEGKIRYFPTDSGMTADDAASLELGNNFEVEQAGYIDTSYLADRNLVFKDLAFKIYIVGPGVIVASIYNVNWTTTYLVASGVTSGEHVIKVTADTVDLKLFIDGEEKDSEALGGVSVPNNANDWYFVTNGSMPYMEYHKITTSGTLTQHIVFELDTTFTDLSGNGNDATPTFRTTSSNADVSATFSNYRPVKEAQYTGTGEEDMPDFIGPAPDEPPTMYSEGTINLPGSELINTILDGGNIPRSLFWFPALFLSVIAVIFVVAWVSKSLMISVISGGALMAYFSLAGGIPFWTVIIYAVIGAALVLKRETIGL